MISVSRDNLVPGLQARHLVSGILPEIHAPTLYYRIRHKRVSEITRVQPRLLRPWRTDPTQKFFSLCSPPYIVKHINEVFVLF